MICFALNGYKIFASSLIKGTKIKLGKFSVNRFPNQELYILVNDKVLDKECLVVGTIAPPDENLLSLALLCHTLKKEGAKRIILVLPYIAYSRQDRLKPGESLATDLIGGIFKATGVEKIITIDVHSNKILDLYSVPVISISPVKIFAEEIKKSKLEDATLIAPDKGALARSEEIVKMLGMNDSIAYLDKQRTLGGVKHLGFHGEVKKRAIIVDDMLDTGGTLVSCCEKLKDAGVKEIYIMVTHGLFTGDKWKKLLDLGVKKIYCTDTVYGAKDMAQSDKKIVLLPSTILFREYLKF